MAIRVLALELVHEYICLHVVVPFVARIKCGRLKGVPFKVIAKQWLPALCDKQNVGLHEWSPFGYV